MFTLKELQRISKELKKFRLTKTKNFFEGAQEFSLNGTTIDLKNDLKKFKNLEQLQPFCLERGTRIFREPQKFVLS